MPRTSSGGIRSVCHMRRQMRNSSFVASTDSRYASTGTLSHHGALPHRKASRHLCSSSSPSSSSSAVTHSSDLFLSASVLANFAPRNLDHSSRSWSCVTSSSPLRSLDGLILCVCRLLESRRVSLDTSRLLPHRSAASISLSIPSTCYL